MHLGRRNYRRSQTMLFNRRDWFQNYASHCQNIPEGSKKDFRHIKRYWRSCLQFGVSSDIQALHKSWVQKNPSSRAWQHIGEKKSSDLLKVRILTGCDVRSKIGRKVSTVSKPESYLGDFGIEPLWDSKFIFAKRYLVRVISPKSNCKKFDDLRYEMYKTKYKALNELPPTSNKICDHYFLYSCSFLFNTCK